MTSNRTKKVLFFHHCEMEKFFPRSCLLENCYMLESNFSSLFSLYPLCSLFYNLCNRREHPLSALSNGEISVVSSFNVGGDTFSECVIGDNVR